MIDISGSKTSRGKASSRSIEYLAVLRNRTSQWEKWFSKAALYKHFPNAADAVAMYRKSVNDKQQTVIEPGKMAASVELIKVEINDYEIERRKNIEQNQLLMKELGL